MKEQIAELAKQIQKDNPSLDIRFNHQCIVYLHNGILGMIASLTIMNPHQIVTMFDRPLNLSVNGAKPEDYTKAA